MFHNICISSDGVLQKTTTLGFRDTNWFLHIDFSIGDFGCGIKESNDLKSTAIKSRIEWYIILASCFIPLLKQVLWTIRIAYNTSVTALFWQIGFLSISWQLISRSKCRRILMEMSNIVVYFMFNYHNALYYKQYHFYNMFSCVSDCLSRLCNDSLVYHYSAMICHHNHRCFSSGSHVSFWSWVLPL